MRLKTISQALSAAFQRAGHQQRRRAALLAREIAASQSGLHGKAVDAALKIIREGGSEPDARREIETLSERLDAEYLDLQDRDEAAAKLETLLLFRKARAAAALAFALSADAGQLHEVLYEAAIASDDQAGVVKAVEKALL